MNHIEIRATHSGTPPRDGRVSPNVYSTFYSITTSSSKKNDMYHSVMVSSSQNYSISQSLSRSVSRSISRSISRSRSPSRSPSPNRSTIQHANVVTEQPKGAQLDLSSQLSERRPVVNKQGMVHIDGKQVRVMSVVTEQPGAHSPRLNDYSPIRPHPILIVPQTSSTWKKRSPTHKNNDEVNTPPPKRLTAITSPQQSATTTSQDEILIKSPRILSDPGTPKNSPLGKIKVFRQSSDPGTPSNKGSKLFNATQVVAAAIEVAAAREAAATATAAVTDGEDVKLNDRDHHNDAAIPHHPKNRSKRNEPSRCCCGCCYVSQYATPCCRSLSCCCCLRTTAERPMRDDVARCGCYHSTCCGCRSGYLLTVPVCPWDEEPSCFFGINICFLLPIPYYRYSGGRRGELYFSSFTNEDQFVKPGQAHFRFAAEGIELQREVVWGGCFSFADRDFLPEICHCQTQCN